jgi:signal transduction histidine kinase
MATFLIAPSAAFVQTISAFNFKATRFRALIKKSQSHKSVLNANELFKNILPLMRPQLEREQIELRIDLVADLASISGDSVRRQQVVLLLRNF